MLIVPKLGFISYQRKMRKNGQIKPSTDDSHTMNGQSTKQSSTDKQQRPMKTSPSTFVLFYRAPIVKFLFYMVRIYVMNYSFNLQNELSENTQIILKSLKLICHIQFAYILVFITALY